MRGKGKEQKVEKTSKQNISPINCFTKTPPSDMHLHLLDQKYYILFNSFSSVSQKYTISRKAKFKIIEKMFMSEIVINKVSH